MTDEDALKEEVLRINHPLAPGLVMLPAEALERAMVALREKVTAKAAAQPKRPSLDFQSGRLTAIVRAAEQSGDVVKFFKGDYEAINAAVATLDALRKDVVPTLQGQGSEDVHSSSWYRALARKMLRDLGEAVP